MTARWKRIATRTVQTFAQCEAAKRHNPTAENAGVNSPALLHSSGITGRLHSNGRLAPAVTALVMRCLKGGCA